jgi:hypothetical protein
MSPEFVDPLAQTRRRSPATPSAPSTPVRLDRGDAGCGLDPTAQPDAILPAILDPFAAGAAPAVMTRIALDWIIDEPVLNQLFEPTFRTSRPHFPRIPSRLITCLIEWTPPL